MPVKEPNISDVKRFMMDHDLPDTWRVNRDNYLRYLGMSVGKLVVDGKIKPFHVTGKDTSVELSPVLKKKYINKRYNSPFWFDGYKYFSQKKKGMIRKAMDNEGFSYYMYSEDTVAGFHFDTLYHHQIPASIHEVTFSRFERQFKRMGTVGFLMQENAKNIYAVNILERSILKDGFKENKPILLQLHEDLVWKMYLVGGHHRVQAIRNLMFRNKLPRRTKIPVLLFFTQVKI